MGRTVLLLMDMQKGISAMLPGAAPVIAEAAKAVTAARAASIPIIFVTVSFRPGVPELPERNSMAARVKQIGGINDGSDAAQVDPVLKAQASDIFVTKRRVSAFGGSDLDVVLRGLDAETLVMGGFSTSGVVLSTVRQAADLDYRLTVLRDLCADPEQDVNDFLLDKIFSRQGQVITAQEWIASIAK